MNFEASVKFFKLMALGSGILALGWGYIVHKLKIHYNSEMCFHTRKSSKQIGCTVVASVIWMEILNGTGSVCQSICLLSFWFSLIYILNSACKGKAWTGYIYHESITTLKEGYLAKVNVTDRKKGNGNILEIDTWHKINLWWENTGSSWN